MCRFLRTLQLFLPLTSRNGARVARKGGRGVAEVAVVEVELGTSVVVAAVAVLHREEGALEEVLDSQAHLLEVFQPAVVQGHSNSCHSSSTTTETAAAAGTATAAGTAAVPAWGPGALAATAALPTEALAPLSATLAPATTGVSLDQAVPVSGAVTTTL
ncbi:unnamed protein product [Closterium sp. NIES-53]